MIQYHNLEGFLLTTVDMIFCYMEQLLLCDCGFSKREKIKVCTYVQGDSNSGVGIGLWLYSGSQMTTSELGLLRKQIPLSTADVSN